MATCTTSKFSYDVFLSFRGEDTRLGFTDHLYEALKRKGIISTFRDEEELEIGEEIAPFLLKAIEESRCAVIVLSMNYASSSWCLDELVHIIDSKENRGLMIVPVFYHVQPTEIRKQSHNYGKAFDDREKILKSKWSKDFMKIVVDVTGWDVDDRIQSACFDEAFAILGKKFEDDEEKVNRWMEVLNNMAGQNLENSKFREQAGKLCKAMIELEKDVKCYMERKNKWREALTKVANAKGIHLQYSPETEAIQKISRRISYMLSLSFLRVNKRKLIGMDDRIEKLKPYLHMELSDDVRMIGITGMGGIGKTTVVQEIFRRYHDQFEAYCHIENVRNKAEKIDGLVSLQRFLCRQLLDDEVNIQNDDQGMTLLQHRLQSRKVMIILDDVDDLKQIKALAGKDDEDNIWLGPGSRVIITTRNERLLVAYGVENDNICKLDEMSHKESLQLFCEKAFKESHPPDNYKELSKVAVTYCKGLPLAIEVIGSSLYKRTESEWIATLERLKEEPEDDIIGKLRISFDGLKELEKEIFLDIACFFNGEHRCRLEKIFESCGFHPGISINILQEKCLLNIEDDEMWMHDLLREMGRHLVRHEFYKDPSKRSRIWLYKDAYDMLLHENETNVEGMFLIPPKKEEIHLKDHPYSKMRKLRFLMIHNVKISGPCEHLLSNNLRLLLWDECPLKFLPSSFHPKNLVELRIRCSNISQLWNEKVVLDKLKVIDLSHNQFLTMTPDLSNLEAPKLSQLIFVGCKNLNKVHPSFNDFKEMVYMDLEGCENLESLPDFSRNLECLEKIVLDGTAIKEIPRSIKSLKGLRRLSTQHCKSLSRLPSFIRNMPLKIRPGTCTSSVQDLKDMLYGGKPNLWHFRWTRIPDWCSNSSFGSSVEIKPTPEESDHEFVAFILFAVFETYKPNRPMKSWDQNRGWFHIYDDQNHDIDYIELPLEMYYGIGASTWCCYCGLSQSENELIKKANFIKVEVCSNRPDMHVKYCGMHLISKQDMTEFVEDFIETCLNNDSNFYGHCKQLLYKGVKLDSLFEVMDLKYDEMSRTLPYDQDTDTKARTKCLELRLSTIFEVANARKYRYFFSFPFGFTSNWFFHLCPGKIATCLLPDNMFDDKRWVGIEFYASITLSPALLPSDHVSISLHVDLYLHGSNAFHIATFSHEIIEPTGSSNHSLLLHVPCALFTQELNSCSGISALFRSTSTNVHVHLSATHLVYEQDLDPLSQNIVMWTSEKPQEAFDIVFSQCQRYAEKVTQCLPEAETLECNVDGDIPIECAGSFNKRELIQLLQKLFTSTEQETKRDLSLLQTYLPRITDAQYFEVFESVIVHSKRYILDSKDLILYLLSHKEEMFVLNHIHVMIETVVYERQLEDRNEELGSLLERLAIHNCWVSLSLKGHMISVLKMFDPWLTYNFYFPQKELLNWFTENSNMSSTARTELPKQIHKDINWRGLAICVGFSIPYENLPSSLEHSFKILCHLKAEGICLNPVPTISITWERIRWLHLRGFIWVTYVPRALLTELRQQSYVDAHIYTDCQELVVNKCAIRLLYHNDEKIFKKDLLKCYTSFLQDVEFIRELGEALETSGSNNTDQVRPKLLQMPEEEIKRFDEYEIYNSWLPATPEIFDWFKSSKRSGTSMIIPLPSYLSDTNWIGLTLFAYFSDVMDPENSHNLFVHLETVFDSFERLQYQTPSREIKCVNHGGFIWLSFVPRRWFLDRLEFKSILEASFGNGVLEAESCGLRLLHQHEEEEFKQQCIDKVKLLENQLRRDRFMINDDEVGSCIAGSSVEDPCQESETPPQTMITKLMGRLFGRGSSDLSHERFHIQV